MNRSAVRLCAIAVGSSPVSSSRLNMNRQQEGSLSSNTGVRARYTAED